MQTTIHSPLYYLVMSEIPHQSAVDVGVVGDATQDLGTLEGGVWVGAAVVQIPARDKQRSKRGLKACEAVQEQNAQCLSEASG